MLPRKVSAKAPSSGEDGTKAHGFESPSFTDDLRSLEPLIVRETKMRPFCGPVKIAPHPSPLLPTRGRAMTSGAPGLGSAQPIQARRHFVAPL